MIEGISIFVFALLSTIPRLLLGRRPATVAGFIISVVVNSVYAVTLRWLDSHVSKEQDEVLPSLADFDSTTGITQPATSEHAFPSSVFRRSVQSVTKLHIVPARCSFRSKSAIWRDLILIKKLLHQRAGYESVSW